MRKAGILSILLVVVLLAVAVTTNAQQSGKIFRIGFLERSTASGSAGLLTAFREEMSNLGWIEGKNITIEVRFADQKVERLPELAAELVRLKVDVIVTGGVAPTSFAKKATATIPIVFTQDPDPVGNGFVVSLARPGGNVTGNSALGTELNSKRLEILNDTVPKLTRVGILRQEARGITEGITMKEVKPAALALKLKLEEIEIQLVDAKGLESAFQTAKQKQVNAILWTGGRAIFGERKRIVELAGKHRLPAVYFQKEFVEAGGLMSYGVDYDDLFRKAAHYVDKILKGAKPADLPVQQATKFEFVINLKAAKQIGLTIPVRVLERANKVIK